MAKFSIGCREYPSKKAAEKDVRDVLYGHDLGDSVTLLEAELLFDLFELDDLREAWNITMLEIIKKAAEAGDIITGSEPVNGNVFTAECEADQGGHWKLTPVARCWVWVAASRFWVPAAAPCVTILKTNCLPRTNGPWWSTSRSA